MTYLTHELGDDTMEGGSLVSVPLLSSTQSSEVLGGPRDDIRSQFHDNPPNRSSISSDVEENSGHDFMKI